MFLGVSVFFFLSGMTFCWEQGTCPWFDHRPWQKFRRDLWKTLVRPYLMWATISVVIYSFLGKIAAGILQSDRQHFTLWTNIVGMLYGNSGSGGSGGYMEWNRPLWFLTCLTMVKLIWYFLLGIKGKTGRVLRFLTMILSAAWLVGANLLGIHLHLPWELETAVSVLFCFGVGRYYRGISDNIGGIDQVHWPANGCQPLRRWIGTICCIGCGIALFFLLLPEQTADFRADRFTHPWRIIPQVLLGLIFVIGISRQLQQGHCWGNRILNYLGRRSMSVLVLHKFMIVACRILSVKIFIDENFVMLVITDLCIAIITVILCLMTEKVISSLAPTLLGRE